MSTFSGSLFFYIFLLSLLLFIYFFILSPHCWSSPIDVLFFLSSRFHFLSRFCLSRPKPSRKACLFFNPIIFKYFQSPFLSYTLPDWFLFNTYHRYDMQFFNFIFSSLFCICNSFFHPFFFSFSVALFAFLCLFYTPLLTSI